MISSDKVLRVDLVWGLAKGGRIGASKGRKVF